MTNYSLEEDALLKLQIDLSVIFIFTILISISLSYNSMMECKNKIYNDEEALNILRINRVIAFFVSIGFIYINVRDKSIKEKYDLDIGFADIQILASAITLISSLLVLYVAFSGTNGPTLGENPN